MTNEIQKVASNPPAWVGNKAHWADVVTRGRHTNYGGAIKHYRASCAKHGVKNATAKGSEHQLVAKAVREQVAAAQVNERGQMVLKLIAGGHDAEFRGPWVYAGGARASARKLVEFVRPNGTLTPAGRTLAA